MITGSCHCGAVRYEIHGRIAHVCELPLSGLSKIHRVGIFFGVGHRIPGIHAHFRGRQPHSLSVIPGKQRRFCKTCGCHIFLRAEHRPGMIFVRAGTLDDDPEIRPQGHFWTSMKAPWHDICDSLPQHLEGLPQK